MTTILTELAKFEVNFDLLKETRVGIIVNKCKKKFQDNTIIASQCSELIDTWKKLAEASKKPATVAASSTTSIPITKETEVVALASHTATTLSVPSTTTESTIDTTTTTTSTTATTDGLSPRDGGANFVDEEFNALCESLPANRKKIIELFTNILVTGLTSSQANVAKSLAFSIESSLNNTFKDNESYMAKFRSLSSNLKKNDVSSTRFTNLYYLLSRSIII